MDFMKSLVRGFMWKARMSNGALFDWWTPMTDTTRAEAREKLLEIANGGMGLSELIYTKEDIESLWKTKNIRSLID